jgi:hypothetical protein
LKDGKSAWSRAKLSGTSQIGCDARSGPGGEQRIVRTQNLLGAIGAAPAASLAPGPALNSDLASPPTLQTRGQNVSGSFKTVSNGESDSAVLNADHCRCLILNAASARSPTGRPASPSNLQSTPDGRPSPAGRRSRRLSLRCLQPMRFWTCTSLLIDEFESRIAWRRLKSRRVDADIRPRVRSAASCQRPSARLLPSSTMDSRLPVFAASTCAVSNQPIPQPTDPTGSASKLGWLGPAPTARG